MARALSSGSRLALRDFHGEVGGQSGDGHERVRLQIFLTLFLGESDGDDARRWIQCDAFVADDVILNVEVQFGLSRRSGFGEIDLIAELRFAGFLQRQVALSRNDFHFLKGVRVRRRNPDTNALARRQDS